MKLLCSVLVFACSKSIKPGWRGLSSFAVSGHFTVIMPERGEGQQGAAPGWGILLNQYRKPADSLHLLLFLRSFLSITRHTASSPPPLMTHLHPQRLLSSPPALALTNSASSSFLCLIFAVCRARVASSGPVGSCCAAVCSPVSPAHSHLSSGAAERRFADGRVHWPHTLAATQTDVLQISQHEFTLKFNLHEIFIRKQHFSPQSFFTALFQQQTASWIYFKVLLAVFINIDYIIKFIWYLTSLTWLEPRRLFHPLASLQGLTLLLH